jgi:SPP1 gp7 family putative phage head morphogenesis protein
MATVNEKLLSEIVAHEIDVLGYGNSVSRKIIKILNKSDENIFARLNKIIDALPTTTINVKRIDKLLQPIVKANNEAYYQARRELQNEMREFTDQELDFQTEIVNKESPVPIKTIAPEQVYAAALAKPFQGELLSEFFAKLSEQKATLITNAVRMGLIEGQTTSAIVKQIRGTRALQFKDGVLAITRRNAESVVLTSLAHFQNFAQESLYDANDDIIKGFRYTATLDTRTTELCASRDGNFYKIGEPKPAIPAHYRCRSRYVPVLKSFRELGLDADEFTPSTRASMDGQVPDKLTYSDWLSKQSVARQSKVLGKAKAELFRDGKLPLDKFVAPSGHVYTLDQLKELNKSAFD